MKSIDRKEPKIFAEFLTIVEEFIKVDDYLQSRKDHKGDNKQKDEDETKTEKVEESKKPKTETKFSNYRTYTPLTTSPDQILMQIKNRNLLTPPAPLKGNPNLQDRTKYCRFHNDHGYLTIECF